MLLLWEFRGRGNLNTMQVGEKIMENQGTKLIIPSAKLVPEELQNLGKLPGIIYPVNQKIVFDYLYEQYGNQCDSVEVVCYEGADKVLRRLSKHTKKNVQIRVLPELKDLGHTIYYAIKDLEVPVVINFADTIVMENICQYKGDVFYYAEDYFSDVWTYFEEKEGKITSIYDKIKGSSDEVKKLFVGVFKLEDSQKFKKCLEIAFGVQECQMSSFYYALKLYSEQYPLKAIKTVNWFDIGHADTYFTSKLEVRAREFNHITIDKDRGILRKSSDDKDKFLGEILWYLKLPADIEYVRPRIFSYSTDYTDPYVAMEYYAYHTLHELFLYGDLQEHQWRDVFKRIYFVYEDFQRYKLQDVKIRDALEDMYVTKTQQRFDRMRKDERFQSFFTQPLCVNQVKYKSLNQIEKVLKETIPNFLYDVDHFSVIHGDLCFANIMIDKNFSFIKVIDPRGKFGEFDIYGDSRYELAKLFHSIDGKYDFIIKDLFTVNYDAKRKEINYQIIDRNRDFDIYQLFVGVFKDAIRDELKKIELIEALLFLTMIPLHGESFEHQLVMLATGIQILDRVIDIREK